MNTNFTPALKSAICLLLISLLFTPFTKAQQTSTFSMPGYTMEYSHNGTIWNHVRNITNTYNSAGLLTESVAIHPQTGQNISKGVITYDAKGNRRSVIMYAWQNMGWVMVNGTRDSLTYNGANKIIRKLTTTFQNKVWENNLLEENTYDPFNNLTESTISTWDTTAWMPGSRYAYTYDATGIMTVKVTYLYLNTPWPLIQTDSYSAWHVPNKLPAAYTRLVSGSQNPTRHTVTQGPNGGYTEVSEYFYPFTNTWGYSNRLTITMDSYGNETGRMNENFDLASNTWVRQAESRHLYTYNTQGDMVQNIRQTTDNTSQPNRPLLNIYKLVHSNFQYFSQPLGTPENQKVNLALTVYPNPATDKIKIELAEQNQQTLTATISDLTGKSWKTQIFKAAETKQLNLENLPKGIYLLHLKTETGSTVKRIVKQ